MRISRFLSRTLLAAALVGGLGMAFWNAPARPAVAADAAPADIVDTAVAAGSFKTLATALKAAGLIETLKGSGPFTVFAPTDEAFSKLPSGTVENLLKPENKAQLVKVLTYHVVSGKVMAAEVTKLKTAKTVEGGSLAIKITDGKVFVDNAQVTKTDIAASNGVIHVIDAVVLPK
jgi:transforming growth factor-beta-induced protein